MSELWNASIEVFGTMGTAVLICALLFFIYISFEIYTDQRLK